MFNSMNRLYISMVTRERESRLPMIEPVYKYDVIEINPFEIKKSNRYSAINNYFVFFFEK